MYKAMEPCSLTLRGHEASAATTKENHQCLLSIWYKNKKKNTMAFSLYATYTNWATATCWRNLVSTSVDRGVLRGQCSEVVAAALQEGR
jgi:hypothetical protein